jgi:hypothetical protein
VTGPVLSHPAQRKRLFLDKLDFAIETLENVPSPICRTAIYNDDLFRGIVQFNE